MIAKSVATLKLEGSLPHLDKIFMLFTSLMGMRLGGLPPLTLDEIKAGVEKHLGTLTAEAKLELTLEQFT